MIQAATWMTRNQERRVLRPPKNEAFEAFISEILRNMGRAARLKRQEEQAAFFERRVGLDPWHYQAPSFVHFTRENGLRGWPGGGEC